MKGHVMPQGIRVLTDQVLVPAGVAAAIAAGAVSLAFAFGGDRGDVVRRVTTLEEAVRDQASETRAQRDRLDAMAMSLYRIEGALGTRPSNP